MRRRKSERNFKKNATPSFPTSTQARTTAAAPDAEIEAAEAETEAAAEAEAAETEAAETEIEASSLTHRGGRGGRGATRQQDEGSGVVTPVDRRVTKSDPAAHVHAPVKSSTRNGRGSSACTTRT